MLQFHFQQSIIQSANMKNKTMTASANTINTNTTNSNTNNTNSTRHDLSATAEMCHHAFDTLLSHLIKHHRVNANILESIPKHAHCPIFVTWETKQGNVEEQKKHDSYRLRGCIGTLSPKHLSSGLGEYAGISAFRDSRFEPIQLSEVKHLKVAVSLLVSYEECQHVYDWIVGIHGIIISFTVNGRHYNATYLPEVSMQQGWTQEEAIESLVRKAGWYGHIQDHMIQSIRCTRYQSSKEHMMYEEYVQRLKYDPLNTTVEGMESTCTI